MKFIIYGNQISENRFEYRVIGKDRRTRTGVRLIASFNTREEAQKYIKERFE